MADSKKLQIDIAALDAAVKANTAAIIALGGIVLSDKSTIAGLTQKVADLSALNPELDLSMLEDDLAQLSANNAAAAQLVPPPA